jgi:predicted permease
MRLDPEQERIREEVRHHLRELQDRLEAEGRSPDEARDEALRRFGDPHRVERATQAARGSSARGLPGGVRGDVVQAARGLLRAPVFSLTVVLTLALALGPVLTVFGVVWDVLVRPLSVPDAASVVVLTERFPEGGLVEQPTSRGTFQDWKRDLATVSELAAWSWDSRTFEDVDRPEELISLESSGNALDMLGIRPVVGRALAPRDEVVGAPATTMMISHDLWTRRFDADPAVVGRVLQVDGVGREVVGVLPPRPDVIGTQADLVMPSALIAADPTNRGVRQLTVVARRAPDIGTDAVAAEVARRTEAIAEEYPTSARGWSADATELGDWLYADVRPRLAVAFAAVLLLLLVAAVNATNLFAVRSADARREMAVRAALGAGRGALVRLRLIESGLLATAGAGLGVLLAQAARSAFLRWDPSLLPRALEPGLPAVSAGVAFLLAGALAALVGGGAAVRGAEAAIGGVARGTAGGRGARRGRDALVVVQLALTVVLLVGAGLLVRTARAVGAVDLGFEPAGLVAARVALPASRYATTAAEETYFAEVLETIRALPGVVSAGVTSALPMDPIAANFDLPTRADPATGWGEAPQADFRMVDDGVMSTMGYRLREGRLLVPSDRGGPMVAVVNESLAELLWPGESPIGRQVQSVWRQDGFSEVVGVVEDTRFYGPREDARPELFFPSWQVGWGFMTIVAKTEGDPQALAAEVERVLVRVDPLLPPQDVFAVDRLVADASASERVYAALLGVFALVALALAAAGVYGLLAYGVRLRAREMGVRIALGASRESVVGGVVRRGVGLAALGVALGLVAAWPVGRWVSGMLFGIGPTDPVTLASVVGILLTVATAACLVPAMRAGRLDPVRILRDD